MGQGEVPEGAPPPRPHLQESPHHQYPLLDRPNQPHCKHEINKLMINKEMVRIRQESELMCTPINLFHIIVYFSTLVSAEGV